ncbi:hypothetical protein [Scytonema sp. HK-05]|uniref:hypothetical protein n=1 Tax=Scytonema sp. HK-05 TaxID=1137095 RepID=UPI001161381E|nr:hypothetical protein [Scytonema sp. HK-05]
MNSYLRSDACYGGGFKPALRVCLRHVFDERHLLYLGKPQDRSGSPPTLSGPIGVVFTPTMKLITLRVCLRHA